MPRALALETSGRIGSVALVEDGVVLGEHTFPHGLKHAAAMIPLVDGLMRTRGWTPRDLGEIYLSLGPGSFTGLRIAVTVAKTMALATGAKVVAVPTVAVLARNAPPEATSLIIVLDAKREQIFTARFSRGAAGAWAETEPAHVDSLPAMLDRSPRPVHLLGEGLPYHEKFVPKDDPGVIVTPAETWRARAAAVAEIGVAMAAAGRFADPFTLTPLYIRKPEAEEKYEQARG